jgi:hypothetical protein
MSPDDNELHESPLSPADDARIRRLLAEARHDGPIPAEVATRLDDALAGLVADRRDRDAAQPAPLRHGGPVVDLAARRRRTVANLLVAAAAVIAVGIGIGQVLPDGLGGSGDAMTAEDAGGDGELVEGGAAEAPQEEAAPNPADDGAAVTIRPERFAADVQKVRDQVARGAVQSYADLSVNPESARADCVTVGLRPGKQVPASYDGARAVLVLRPSSGDVQVVDLYLCGDTEPRRSITLTTP